MSNIIKAIQQAHEEYQLKGGAGSGNFGHSGRPGKIGGSSGGKGGGGNSTPKGYSIQFEGVPGYHKLADFTDAHIEKKLAAVEKATGKKLEVDPQTGFPNFTVYRDGEEIGGG